MWDYGLEGAFPRKSAYMKLIQDVIGKLKPGPRDVLPGEEGIANLTGPVDAQRLASRSRIGALCAAIETVKIEMSRTGIAHDPSVVSQPVFREGHHEIVRRGEVDFNQLRCGAPHAETGLPFTQICSSQR